MTLLRQGSSGSASPIGGLAPVAAGPERRREELLGDLKELFQARALERGRASRRGAGTGGRPLTRSSKRSRERRRRPRQPGGDSVMQTIVQDLRYAFRSLCRQPRLRGHRGADAGARHRRQRHDLQLGQPVLLNPMPGATQHGRAACSSRTSIAATCCRASRIPTTRTSRVPRNSSAAITGLRRPRRRHRDRSRSRARVGGDRHRELLRRARRAGHRSGAASRLGRRCAGQRRRRWCSVMPIGSGGSTAIRA